MTSIIKQRMTKGFWFLTLALLIIPQINLFAQAPDTLWTKTFGGTYYDYGYSVQQTTDDGYIITGYTNSFGGGGTNVYLIKIDENGDTLWTKTFGGTYLNYGYSVQQTSDGGYIIAGYTGFLGASDVYLIKTDTLGNQLWTKTFGGINDDIGYSVKQTSDGGYIIVGYTTSFGAGGHDVYLIKTDANGDSTWTKTYGGTDDDGGREVQCTSDGGYIIVGHTQSFGAGEDNPWLIKTNASGDTTWTKTYGWSGMSYVGGSSVQQTMDGGYIIAGSDYGLAGRVYLARGDTSGEMLWQRTYSIPYTHECYGSSVQQTSDGGYIIAGTADSSTSGYYDDVLLIKTDSLGDTLWTKTYGGTDDDDGREVQCSSDGGYIIVGHTQSFGAGAGDVYIIKTESEPGIEERRTSSNIFIHLQISQNPFRERIDIRCQIADKDNSNIVIQIYNVLGHCVKTFNRLTNQSINQIIWNGDDDSGHQLPAGVYFVRLETDEYTATRKIIKLQ